MKNLQNGGNASSIKGKAPKKVGYRGKRTDQIAYNVIMVFDSYRTLVDYFHFMLVQNSTQFMHSFEASQKKGRKVKKEKTFKEKTTVAAALAW